MLNTNPIPDILPLQSDHYIGHNIPLMMVAPEIRNYSSNSYIKTFYYYMVPSNTRSHMKRRAARLRLSNLIISVNLELKEPKIMHI